MKRFGVVLILFLALCGVADSVYINQHETSGTPLICSIGDPSGCNTVAESQYSRLFGVPISVYGILFYSILFVLAALELVIFDELLRRALMWLSLAGVLFSLYLVVVQMFVIRAFCLYCYISATVALLIFICALLTHVKHKKTARAVSFGSPLQPSS